MEHSICLLDSFDPKYNSSLLFFIDFLFDLPIAESGVLTSPTTIAFLPIFAFRSVNNCLICLDASILGAHILTIIIYS